MESNVRITLFQDKYLVGAETLLKEHTDIFSVADLKIYRQDLLEYLLNNHQRHIVVLTLLEENEVVGVTMYRREEQSQNYYKIEWFVVKKSLQNRGHGTFLMQEAFNRIKSMGGKHVYVETSYEKHNETAKHFYEKLGFKKMGVLPDYFIHPMKKYHRPEDYILYHKHL